MQVVKEAQKNQGICILCLFRSFCPKTVGAACITREIQNMYIFQDIAVANEEHAAHDLVDVQAQPQVGLGGAGSAGGGHCLGALVAEVQLRSGNPADGGGGGDAGRDEDREAEGRRRRVQGIRHLFRRRAGQEGEAGAQGASAEQEVQLRLRPRNELGRLEQLEEGKRAPGSHDPHRKLSAGNTILFPYFFIIP